jgi:hypothetical protein
MAGKCGVASARAVAVNITAVTPSSTGHICPFPTGVSRPGRGAQPQAGATARARHLGLGDGGKLTLRTIQVSGSVHVVIDVAGWFE